MAVVRIAQLDGKLPNLALMRLASWHRAQGHDITYFRGADAVSRHLGEPAYIANYASAIFKFSEPLVAQYRSEWPDAVVGGTGTDSRVTVEEVIGDHGGVDYSVAPSGFTASLGFTQRGCRLKCKFCVVPGKEGKPSVARTIADIWRGDPWPRNIHLLDNDFFGQPQAAWEARIDELRSGAFRVCFNQGLNVRLIDRAAAQALASVEYRDDGFTRRRLYTAWDNLKDERVFMRGVDTLEAAGIPPSHLMAYMLIGFDPTETWERIFLRFDAMVARGIRPYPMVFDASRRDLKRFQRWVVTGLYRAVPFSDYDASVKSKHRANSGTADLFVSNA